MAFLAQSAELISQPMTVPHPEGVLAHMAVRPKQLHEQSDEILLALIGAGDAEAFRCLTERHIDRAYAVAFRITGNAADSEDVVQDTLLKVWVLGNRWEGGRAKFTTWLYRVIVNRCIDLKRRPQNDDVDTIEDVASHAPDQVNELIRNETTDRLARALADLPDQQRLALIFSYYENLSNAQIAEIMETSVMAVESLLKRGRKHLRESLRIDGPEMLNSLQND